MSSSDRWPIAFKYAADVFCYMRDNAVEADEGLVYTGSMLEVRHILDIPNGSWSQVKKFLQDSAPSVDDNGRALSVVGPCLILLKRGANRVPSRWLINRPLSELDLTISIIDKKSSPALDFGGDCATLVSECNRLRKRIEKLELRIRELESKLTEKHTKERNAKAT